VVVFSATRLEPLSLHMATQIGLMSLLAPVAALEISLQQAIHGDSSRATRRQSAACQTPSLR